MLLALVFSTLGSGDLFASGIKKSEFKKEISKEFPISSKGKVSVAGKYGDVHVSTWDKNKVKFDVTIIVKSPSKEKADKLFKRIKIKFENGDDFAKGLFSLEEGSGNWWKDFKGSSYKIHFDVKLPATNSVNIYNKYGKIHLGDIKGAATLENKYGDIKTGDIGGDVKLTLGYSKNSDFGKIGDFTVEMKYSKIDVESAGDVKVSSKYSQIYIDKAGDVKTETKYDKYHLGTIKNLRNHGKYDDFEVKSVNNVDVTGDYSDYTIKELNGKAEFDMDYGDAEIKKVGSGFKGVSFSGKYTDLIINLEGKGANVDIKTRYTKVKLPESLKKEHYHKDNEELEIKGSIGSGNVNIKATAKYGSVIIYD